VRKVAIVVGIVCIILVASLIGAFEYYTTSLDNKNRQISSLNSQTTSLQALIQSDNSSINSLKTQVAELESQLSSNNSMIAADNATIINLQHEIAGLSNDIDLLQAQYDQLNQTYQSSFLFNSSDGMPTQNNSLQPQILITYPPSYQDYANAILRICDVALKDYCNVFHMYNGVYADVPPAIHVFIYTNTSLLLEATPSDYRIYVEVRSINDTSPNVARWVYGFADELGYIVFSTDNHAFNEGWAFYAAASRIVPDIYSQLGNDAWPQPYNYSQTDGLPLFLSQIENSSLTTPYTPYAAAKILYTIDQEYGPMVFSEAMQMCHATSDGFYNYPIYALTEFEGALVNLTNDTSLWQLFNENGF